MHNVQYSYTDSEIGGIFSASGISSDAFAKEIKTFKKAFQKSTISAPLAEHPVQAILPLDIKTMSSDRGIPGFPGKRVITVIINKKEEQMMIDKIDYDNLLIAKIGDRGLKICTYDVKTTGRTAAQLIRIMPTGSKSYKPKNASVAGFVLGEAYAQAHRKNPNTIYVPGYPKMLNFCRDAFKR